MNNCQKIKMMDCEAFANFLIDNFAGDCDICPAWNKDCGKNDIQHFPHYCRKNIIEWLQSEVSDDYSGRS